MNDTKVEELLRTMNLADPVDRQVLADKFAEAGMDADAELLRDEGPVVVYKGEVWPEVTGGVEHLAPGAEPSCPWCGDWGLMCAHVIFDYDSERGNHWYPGMSDDDEATFYMLMMLESDHFAGFVPPTPLYILHYTSTTEDGIDGWTAYTLDVAAVMQALVAHDAPRMQAERQAAAATAQVVKARHDQKARQSARDRARSLSKRKRQ